MQLALSNRKVNKSHSLLIGFTIILTTVLLTILSLGGYGAIQINRRNAGQLYGEFHGAFLNIEEAKLKDIDARAEFETIGFMDTIAEISLGDTFATTMYMDDTAAMMLKVTLLKGHMPIARDEIAGQQELFQALGYEDVAVGDEVVIPYRVQGKGIVLEHKFRVSGILPSSDISDMKKIYSSYASKFFYEETIPEWERSYTVYFKTYNENKLNSIQLEEYIKIIATELFISENNLKINQGYLMWTTNPNKEVIVFCVVIASIILLFSSFVIYNIFHIGLIQKIREFGKLRAIGTTKKQIKQMIIREGFVIAIWSIPIGLVLGMIFTKLLFHILLKIPAKDFRIEYQEVSLFHGGILLFVGILSLAMVYHSLRRPMKIASNISPMDAVRYQEKGRITKERKGYRDMNLFRLTISNLSRNRNRTLTTIVTMGLSCVLFVIIANVAGNMRPSVRARDMIEYGEFYISLDGAYHDIAYPQNDLNQLQKNHLMGVDFITAIKNIDGVTSVKARKVILAKVNNDSIDEESRYVFIDVLNRDDFQAKQKSHKRGVMDYDLATKHNGIIYCWDYGLTRMGYQLDHPYSFTLFDGDRNVSHHALLQGTCSESKSDFFITEDTYLQLGIKEDLTTKIWVSCEQGKEKVVLDSISTIIGVNPYYKLVTYEDEYKIANSSIRMLRIPAYALLGVLGIIGFFNMANTLITGMIVRKREIGVLQAIGLTKKQLNQMLQMEGYVLTFGILMISLLLGNVVGYITFLKCQELNWIGLESYYFPFTELGVMIALLLLLQLFLTFIISHEFQKEATIERIRFYEA